MWFNIPTTQQYHINLRHALSCLQNRLLVLTQHLDHAVVGRVQRDGRLQLLEVPGQPQIGVASPTSTWRNNNILRL